MDPRSSHVEAVQHTWHSWVSNQCCPARLATIQTAEPNQPKNVLLFRKSRFPQFWGLRMYWIKNTIHQHNQKNRIVKFGEDNSLSSLRICLQYPANLPFNYGTIERIRTKWICLVSRLSTSRLCAEGTLKMTEPRVIKKQTKNKNKNKQTNTSIKSETELTASVLEKKKKDPKHARD